MGPLQRRESRASGRRRGGDEEIRIRVFLSSGVMRV